MGQTSGDSLLLKILPSGDYYHKLAIGGTNVPLNVYRNVSVASLTQVDSTVHINIHVRCCAMFEYVCGMLCWWIQSYAPLI